MNNKTKVYIKYIFIYKVKLLLLIKSKLINIYIVKLTFD